MVARHYDVGASALTLDWINLGTTMAGIYGVRIIGIAARRKAARSPRSAPPGPGHNGGPPMEDAPADADQVGVVDWSLMTGGGRPN